MKPAALFLFFALFLPGCDSLSSLTKHSVNGSRSLMPGNILTLENRSAVELKIRSDYPISISGSGCSVVRTVDENLNCGPADIVITDQRPRLLIWARSNQVSWTATTSF